MKSRTFNVLLLLTLFSMMIISGAGLAEAASNMELDQSTIKIGDSSTSRDTVHTKYLNLTNTGTQPISNIQVEAQNTLGSSLDSAYSANTNLASSTLQPGNSTTITVSIRIPEYASSREDKIGRLEVTGDTSNIVLHEYADIDMQAESFLHIEEVEVEVDGDKDDINNGDDVDVKVDDSVTVYVTLENQYSKNIELEDAFFQMDDDGDWYLNDESDEKGIDDGDEETFEISFTVPDDADDEDVDVLLEAFAEDGDHGFDHFDTFDFEFELDKKSHEIVIDSWKFLEEPVDCSRDEVGLEIDLKNIGKDDEDEAVLHVISKSGELDWHKRLMDLHIDEGERRTETVYITLPDDVSEGAYFINLEAFHEVGDMTDNETIALEVECDEPVDETGGDGAEDTSDNESVVVVGDSSDDASGSSVEGQQDATPNAVSGEEISSFSKFRSSTGYLVLLIVIALAFLGAIGYLFHQIIVSRK